MPCTPFTLPDGTTGIVCSRGGRRKTCTEPGCSREATKLCDFPVTRRGKSATCDRGLCGAHAMKQGPDRDYCGPHHRLQAAKAAP